MLTVFTHYLALVSSNRRPKYDFKTILWLRTPPEAILISSSWDMSLNLGDLCLSVRQRRRNFFRTLFLGGVANLVTCGVTFSEPAYPGRHMRTIIGASLGRVVILSFDRGEKFLESIRDKLRELGIKNAVLVGAVGTFEKARFHRITTTQPTPQDEIIEVEGPIELAAVDGVVADGEPHFHMVFQDMNRAYAAHLEDGCVVCYLAEVVLVEIRGVELTRARNEHGIRLLQQKQ